MKEYNTNEANEMNETNESEAMFKKAYIESDDISYAELLEAQIEEAEENNFKSEIEEQLLEDTVEKILEDPKSHIGRFARLRQKKGFVAGMVAAGFAFSSLFGFLGGALSQQSDSGNGVNGKSVMYQGVSTKTTSKNKANNVSDVIENAKKSVVEITTEGAQSNELFQQSIKSGAGSGVILTNDGYIATNNHVVNGAAKIKVRLSDGKEYPAKVVGTDAEHDLAVLKIEASDLTPAVLGDSKNIKVGDDVLAIGNPLGELGGTVTDGIISALDREINIEGQKMSLLQTSAAVNPGNSGGGLFNANGELVGIVNAKSSGEGVEGLGFAIPINSAKTVIEDLIKNGSSASQGTPSLGISVVDVKDKQTANEYGVNQLGLYVVNSTNEGLKPGDRILSIEGETITDLESCSAVLKKHKVGDTVNIVVNRNGRDIKVKVTLIDKTMNTAFNETPDQVA